MGFWAEDQPTHTTFAGQVIVYYLFPLLVALTLLLISFGVWIVKKIGTHDKALAIIINEVNPPGKESLRDLISNVTTEQARIKGSLEQKENKNDRG